MEGAIWGAGIGALSGAAFAAAGTATVMLGGAAWAAALQVPLWQGMLSVGILISIPERILSAAALSNALRRGDPIDAALASFGIVLSYLSFLPAGFGKGSLSGHKTRIPRNDADPSNIRALTRENESAELLAYTYGLHVEQNPPPRPNGSEPDYKIFGHYADGYAPSTNSLNAVHRRLTEKVARQADRIVVNLEDSPLTPTDITQYLDTNPVTGLKEIIFIKNGKVGFKLY